MPAEPLLTTIRPARPTDVVLTLAPLCRGRADPTMRVRSGEVHRAWTTPAGPVAVRLVQQGREIAAEAWGPGAEDAVGQLPTVLGASDDPSPLVGHHRVVADLHHRFPGLRLCRTGAVLDATVAAVLEQRVTGREAWRAWARLVQTLGEPAPGPLGLRVPAPPQRLAATPWWRYHGFGVERGRAETVRRAGMLASRLEALAATPPVAARARLVAIPGIGPWTAAEVAMLAFGDPDAVSVGDYHIPHLVSWALAGEPRGSDERMLELLEPYRGQRGRVIRLLAAGGLWPPRRGPRLPDRDIARM